MQVSMVFDRPDIVNTGDIITNQYSSHISPWFFVAVFSFHYYLHTFRTHHLQANDGMCPIHAAAQAGHLESLKHLINKAGIA